MKVFSLSSISNREKNLELIIPIILEQCDLLYVNLVGYQNLPQILVNDKIKINRFNTAGSEIRFFNYNDIKDDTYYFTIDDDIMYPIDYADTMIYNMKKNDNKVVCCVHGSILDLNLQNGFYLSNRTVFHFKECLTDNIKVMIPGVGTSCFYKKNVKLDIKQYRVSNMSDPYTGCFLAQQNIERISIKRDTFWLKPLDECGTRIFGKNPHNEIDSLININKKYLI